MVIGINSSTFNTVKMLTFINVGKPQSIKGVFFG